MQKVRLVVATVFRPKGSGAQVLVVQVKFARHNWGT
jgi:hypothetical protein